MENLIRLLNPKTVNYEAIRVDNTKPLYGSGCYFSD